MSEQATGKRRGRWLIVVLVLAFAGAAAGAWAGGQIAPGESAVVVSLAAAGFGLGGLVGMLGLGVRALLMRAMTARDRSSEAAPLPVAAGGDPPPPDAPRDDPPPAATHPDPEPEPAPPGDGQPGWYPDPRQPGSRRYWDGQTWTEHVWRDRTSGARRSPRAPR